MSVQICIHVENTLDSVQVLLRSQPCNKRLL